MKYLSDTEILNWNKRLEKSDYTVRPVYNSKTSHPYIAYRQTIGTPMGNGQFVNTPEPFIRYDFTISIASNRKSTFFELFDRLCKDKFDTKSIYQDLNSEKITDIQFTDSIIENLEEKTHLVYDKEYIRYTYHFGGKLGCIMAYISYLEDAINFFSEMWGYDKDGSEVCLLKYPIGTIVSTNQDKSKDYLVLDYKYRKLDGKYFIDLIASEMLNEGVIIKYGDIKVFHENDLCYSRNSRIDDILN
jgi:hypothetical protein